MVVAAVLTGMSGANAGALSGGRPGYAVRLIAIGITDAFPTDGGVSRGAVRRLPPTEVRSLPDSAFRRDASVSDGVVRIPQTATGILQEPDAVAAPAGRPGVVGGPSSRFGKIRVVIAGYFGDVRVLRVRDGRPRRGRRALEAVWPRARRGARARRND